MINKILEKLNLKFEDLTSAERDTLLSMAESLQRQSLSVSDVKEYLLTMRESVETELSKTDLNTNQDIFLKARLRNYILLESFLTGPDKAKKALDRAVAGMVSSKS